MSFLTRRRHPSPLVNSPGVPLTALDSDLDPMLGDPAGHAAAMLARDGDWRGLSAFLQGVPDVDDRGFYITRLMEGFTGMPPWLDQWLAAEPSSALCHLVRGVRATQWAWEAGSDGTAPTAMAPGFSAFRERLAEADRALMMAATLDPADPLPHIQGLITARGLQLGYPALHARFQHAVHRAPLSYRAHAQLLQGLAKKWSGAHDVMYQFARGAAQAAPDGHPMHTLVAEAHIEGWLDGDRAYRHLYWQVPGIREEIHAAARSSVELPDFDGGAETAAYRNTFAFCFWSLNEPEPLAAQLALIGDKVTRSPWSHMGLGATAAVQSAREFAAHSHGTSPG